MTGVFVNRTLNMKRIKAIGFDMDYTLVRYHTEEFERLAYDTVVQKLIDIKSYPKEISGPQFNYYQVIQGLVIDKKRGNLLKLSLYGKVKQATHGTKKIPFNEQQSIYQDRVIELNNENIQSLDTSFSVSNGVLFGNLVDLKDSGLKLPDYLQMAEDVREMVDLAHRDGTLKRCVSKDVGKFIQQDEESVRLLERYKSYGKKLWVVTNSDYSYSKLLLDYAITPFLKDHSHWSELFDLVVTLSQKPHFFTGNSSFLKIDPETGLMSNHEGPLDNGIYQGGNAQKLQADVQLEGGEILYLGDHIYGDVVSIKKTCNWRSALVLEPLKDERDALEKGDHLSQAISQKMDEKLALEEKLNDFYTKEFEDNQNVNKDEVAALFDQLDNLNSVISETITKYHNFFNPDWGELMRAGYEESRFAGQVEKYACLYMEKISDLLAHSPRTYFRPAKRVLPHELL